MTDVVIIDDKPRVLAAAAAREAGLTTDYLARLAKKGSLAGRQIARVWFWELPSEVQYRNKREARAAYMALLSR